MSNKSITPAAVSGQTCEDRVRAILGPVDSDLATCLETGGLPPTRDAIEDAATIVELLTHVDGGVPDSNGDALDRNFVGRVGYLLQRQIALIERLYEHERSAEGEPDKTEQEHEQAEREASSRSPASTVDLVGFMAGIAERSRAQTGHILAELEAEDPVAAEIVRAQIEAGPDAALYVDPADAEGLGVEEQATAAQAHGQHLVVVTDGAPENVRTWLVGDETAEALRPRAMVAEPEAGKGEPDNVTPLERPAV